MKARAQRPDLQALRGLAVLSVLGFHFFPGIFPNGFVGVDQFFVLSGFLIAMVLDKENTLSAAAIYDFYYKRIKRIVPMYLLVILVTLASSLLVFPQSNLAVNVKSATVALLFLSNVSPLSKESNEYYSMLSLAEDLFTHTWSLAVEMQFYLLIPLIAMLLASVPSRHYPVILLSMGGCSFAYHALSDANTSFYSVLSRIWQFLTGNAAYYYSGKNLPRFGDYRPVQKEVEFGQEQDMEIVGENDQGGARTFVEHACLSILLFGALCPQPLQAVYLRLNTTMATAVLISLNSRSAPPILVHFGDVSYTLYLVHWPIFCWLKLNDMDHTLGLVCGLLSSWILAVLLTETFEKFYRSAEKPSIIALIVLLYGLNSSVILFTGYFNNFTQVELDYVFDNRDPYINITIADAVKLNVQFTARDIASLTYELCSYTERPPHGWCKFRGVNQSAPSTVLILGNSWAANHAPTIHESCRNHTKSMSMYSQAACEVLAETRYGSYSCRKTYVDYADIVEKTKPDYLFIIERHLAIQPKENELNETTRESIQQQVVARIQTFKKSVRFKIFILDAMPRLYTKAISLLNSRISHSSAINQTELIEPTDVKFAQQTLRRAVRACEKCSLISYEAVFGMEHNFRVFNNATKVAFFTGGLHLSPYGLNTVAPIYKKICSLF